MATQAPSGSVGPDGDVGLLLAQIHQGPTHVHIYLLSLFMIAEL